MKEKQFVLTFKESKELLNTGKTTHAYGGIGYSIAINEANGKAEVVGLVPLDSVKYEIVVRK